MRLFVEAALRRHEVENVERTLEQTRPDFSRFEAAKSGKTGKSPVLIPGIIAAVVVAAAGGVWFAMSQGDSQSSAMEPAAQVVSAPAEAPRSEPVAEAAPPVITPAEEAAVEPAPLPEPILAAPAPAPADRRRVGTALMSPLSIGCAPQRKPVVQVPEEVAPPHSGRAAGAHL